jgi:hypothetical protein
MSSPYLVRLAALHSAHRRALLAPRAAAAWPAGSAGLRTTAAAAASVRPAAVAFARKSSATVGVPPPPPGAPGIWRAVDWPFTLFIAGTFGGTVVLVWLLINGGDFWPPKFLAAPEAPALSLKSALVDYLAKPPATPAELDAAAAGAASGTEVPAAPAPVAAAAAHVGAPGGVAVQPSPAAETKLPSSSSTLDLAATADRSGAPPAATGATAAAAAAPAAETRGPAPLMPVGTASVLPAAPAAAVPVAPAGPVPQRSWWGWLTGQKKPGSQVAAVASPAAAPPKQPSPGSAGASAAGQ